MLSAMVTIPCSEKNCFVGHLEVNAAVNYAPPSFNVLL